MSIPSSASLDSLGAQYRDTAERLRARIRVLRLLQRGARNLEADRLSHRISLLEAEFFQLRQVGFLLGRYYKVYRPRRYRLPPGEDLTRFFPRKGRRAQ